MLQRIPEFIANHFLLVSAFVATLAVLILSEVLRRRSAPRSLTPEGLVQLMNQGEVTVIDVRGQSDFKKGHILNARNMSQEQVKGAADKLKSEGSAVVVCCANGMHAPKAAAVLDAAGVSNVAQLKGGIAAWRDAQLPLSRGGK